MCYVFSDFENTAGDYVIAVTLMCTLNNSVVICVSFVSVFLNFYIISTGILIYLFLIVY